MQLPVGARLRGVEESVATTDRAARIGALVFGVFAWSGVVQAESWKISPSVSVQGTLTDNVNLAPNDRKRSDLIMNVAPGIRVDGFGARASLQLDYRMNNLLYASESSRNNTQHFLSALGSLEAVENWLFVDARASISQQAITPFAARPTNVENVNANRAETYTYGLSPYVRGRFGSTADYLLRYNWTATETKGNVVRDFGVSEWVGNVKGGTAFVDLGWAVDASMQNYYVSQGRDTEASRLRGSLIYRLVPEIRLTATAGREANNYLSLEKRYKSTYGGGVDWSPTERTVVSAFRERRFFGDGHDYSFRHRTPLTAWSYSDRKDVSSLPNQLATAGAGTAFDLLFNALASRIPDPVARRQEVERQLLLGGIPPDLALVTTFLTTQVFVDRTRQASLALLGVNNTVTLTGTDTDRQVLGTGIDTLESFASTPSVRQRGVSADWSHRLSPLSSLSVLGSWLRSTGSGLTTLQSTQKAVRMLLSFQLSPQTFASVGARRVQFDSNTGSDYSENALTGSLFVTF
jgi:uncharacterized protein (PEP-CTERM system associated)